MIRDLEEKIVSSIIFPFDVICFNRNREFNCKLWIARSYNSVIMRKKILYLVWVDLYRWKCVFELIIMGGKPEERYFLKVKVFTRISSDQSRDGDLAHCNFFFFIWVIIYFKWQVVGGYGCRGCLGKNFDLSAVNYRI